MEILLLQKVLILSTDFAEMVRKLPSHFQAFSEDELHHSMVDQSMAITNVTE